MGLQGVFASYLWSALSCASALREAAEHGRLGSDTYKRLNLGLMFWWVRGLVLQRGAAAPG